MKTNCQICNKEFEKSKFHKDQKYCTRKCYQRWNAARPETKERQKIYIKKWEENSKKLFKDKICRT